MVNLFPFFNLNEGSSGTSDILQEKHTVFKLDLGVIP
jgi:hypothetical protein